MENKAKSHTLIIILRSGFTLIELSIVLVIIGLLVGGILTGRDLLDAAAQRAQVTQIHRYNTAVRTFQLKYNNLPGDIPDPQASQFGFQARGPYAGEGDGNGIIQGNCNNAAGMNSSTNLGCGEYAVFWEDLGKSNLINGTFQGYDTQGQPYPYTQGQWSPYPTLTSTPSIKDWYPAAKIGSNNFVYVASRAVTIGANTGIDGNNYFVVSAVTNIHWELFGAVNPGITVLQAYNIDKKIDDGLPQSGSVTACYMNESIQDANIWAAGNGQLGAGGNSGWDCVPTTTATPLYLRTATGTTILPEP